MNPLDSPWNRRQKPEQPEAEKTTNPPYIGLRNELSRSSVSSKDVLVLEVRGVSSVPSGPYKIAYSEGATLRYYLYQLRLLHAASYAAIYDKANPAKGRLRMTYIPQKESQILLCPPTVGLSTHLQRSEHDAEKLARNMGKKGRGEAPSEVTGKILR